MEGYDGIERRKRVMESLRSASPVSFGGVAVVEARDYLSGKITYKCGCEKETGKEPADVLYYVLENGDKILVRPSGTEPKIKIYVLAHDSDKDALGAKLEKYVSDAKTVADVK